MGGCVQCDASVWSQKRKNECREKDLKLDFESQMDEEAKLEIMPKYSHNYTYLHVYT